MKKSIFLFTFSIFLFKSSFAASITEFHITSTYLLNTPNVGNNSVVNISPDGDTNITYGVTITRSSLLEQGIDLTLILGTVQANGTLFGFGGTYRITDQTLSTSTILNQPIINIPAHINPNEAYRNRLVLLISDHGGPYQLYSSPNHYITNQPVLQQPLYRLLKPSSGAHFYTTDATELNQALAEGMQSEGSDGNVYNQQKGSLVPLHRYFNPNTGDHFYTLTKTFYAGYNYEGYAAFVYSTQVSTTIPLYRYNNSQSGHFYTTNYNELGAGGGGNVYEGVACYLYPTL